MARLGQVIGVDVGGTFTDLVLLDQATKKVRLAKVPTTVDNQAEGMFDALQKVEADLPNVDLIVHGTTTTTNAVLERKLARTGLITTAGFRDILELGRRTRPQSYGMVGQFLPIIPRDLRLEVDERMDATGQVVTPLDEQHVLRAAEQLLAMDCESIVIHFLHAYANPQHELRAAEIVRSIWPNHYITMGHALLSESREFERGVTAAVNASVQPLLDRYIARLTDRLAEGGYGSDMLVMNGNGGMVSSRQVAKEAVKTVMSGPASGVMAAAYTGRKAGITNLITYDMGGTSTDVALIRDGEPSVSSETEIEYAMPIHVPMVDVRTIGAGGGSIARVNEAGLLEVGPQSAGASPGPICYGKGGELPTISDANLLLGRLNPKTFNAGEGGVSLDHIADIFVDLLGGPLGLDARQAAAAVINLANIKMAGAIRMVSLSLGVDPRDFALFAFGGAGPLHAASLARELAIPRVMVPSRPGITNALGCVVADLRHDFVNTINRPLDAVDIDLVHNLFAEQMAKGQQLIKQQNISIKKTKFLCSVDMQFVGQTHLLRVPLEGPKPDRETLRRLFEETYFARFKVELNEIRANLVNINCSVVGVREELDLSSLIDPNEQKATLADAQSANRQVFFGDTLQATAIYWRDHLPAEYVIHGPSIIEQLDTTILIASGDVARPDGGGNIIIDIASDGGQTR